jgi:membrane-associated phospholipid phosphatase
MDHFRKPHFGWFAAFIACIFLALLSFVRFDMPIAQAFVKNLGQLDDLGAGLGTEVLLSIEAAVALCITALRLMRGHGKLSPVSKALAVASVTSICAYAVNDGVLKILLGVPNPQSVLMQGAHHGFHFFAGAKSSGFPSGHMVLAGSFAGVFLRLYPSSRWPFVILLSIAAILLVVGDWHFLSDVIVGSFIGVSTGVLVGQLWQDHSDTGAG